MKKVEYLLLALGIILLAVFVLKKQLIEAKADRFYNGGELSVCKKILTLATQPDCVVENIVKTQWVRNAGGFPSTITYLSPGISCTLTINGQNTKVTQEDYPDLDFSKVSTLPLGKHCLEFK